MDVISSRILCIFVADPVKIRRGSCAFVVNIFSVQSQRFLKGILPMALVQGVENENMKSTDV